MKHTSHILFLLFITIILCLSCDRSLIVEPITIKEFWGLQKTSEGGYLAIELDVNPANGIAQIIYGEKTTTNPERYDLWNPDKYEIKMLSYIKMGDNLSFNADGTFIMTGKLLSSNQLFISWTNGSLGELWDRDYENQGWKTSMTLNAVSGINLGWRENIP